MTSSTTEYPIEKVVDVAGLLHWMKKRLKAPSLSAVIAAGGTQHSSLISFATGTKQTPDLNIEPLLRVLKATGYVLVAKPKNKAPGILIEVPNADPVMIVGPDGGPPTFVADDLPGIGRLINSLAAANSASVTGVMRRAGANSTSLVSLATGQAGTRATGQAGTRDIRLANLLRYIDGAGFELVVRKAHTSARAARMAFATLNR